MCSWYGQLLRGDPRGNIGICWGMMFWSVYKPFFSPISLPSPDIQGCWFVCCSRTTNDLMSHLSSGLKRHQSTKKIGMCWLLTRQEVTFREIPITGLSAFLFDLFCFFPKYICCRWWKGRGFPLHVYFQIVVSKKAVPSPQAFILLPSLEQTGIYVPFLIHVKFVQKYLLWKWFVICRLNT